MDQTTCNFIRKITHKVVINIVKQSILRMKHRWLNNKSLYDMGKFTLNFQEPLIPQQLLRSGGQHEPLERELRTESEDQYEEAMSDPSKKVSYSYDFCVHHMTGNIIPTLSTGKRDKIHSICLLSTFVDVLIIASRRRVSVNANLLSSNANIWSYARSLLPNVYHNFAL